MLHALLLQDLICHETCFVAADERPSRAKTKMKKSIIIKKLCGCKCAQKKKEVVQ